VLTVGFEIAIAPRMLNDLLDAPRVLLVNLYETQRRGRQIPKLSEDESSGLRPTLYQLGQHSPSLFNSPLFKVYM
jgi:hypothetical protein